MVNQTTTRNDYRAVETELWEAHPSYLYNLPYQIIGGLIFVGSLFVLSNSSPSFFISLSMMIIGVLIIALPMSIGNSKLYTITNMRVKAKTGMLSRSIDQLFFEDIKSINLRQDSLEKLFNLGTIDIVGTADIIGEEGKTEIAVTFQALPEPQEIIEMIRNLMNVDL